MKPGERLSRWLVKRLAPELLEAGAQLRAILDHAPMAVTLRDPDGRLVMVSRAAAEAMGVPAQELLQRPAHDAYLPDTMADVRASELRVLEGEGTVTSELTRTLGDGSEETMLVTKYPVADEDGAITAIGGVTLDITERKRAQRELENAHSAAVAASRAKSEFVANMSHEIRTPLNGVIGMTELLRDTSLDDVQRTYVDALAVSGEAVLAVISDVLDFSKIEAGRLELDETEFSLRDVIEEACRILGEPAHAKGLELSHWIDAEVPERVRGDRVRARQILINLLSNAVKFTSRGEVFVRVRRHDEEAVLIAVSDTGVGIDPEQAALFEPFVQAEKSTTRKHGGTGLGLAISRQLVERMGGEIHAEPRSGEGSTFWFTAKLPAVEEAREQDTLDPTLGGRRALIASDNAMNRAALEHYLGAWGLQCESVERYDAAVDALERAALAQRPFELALIDLNLPRMAGLDLARRIRERETLSEVSLVTLGPATLQREAFADLDISKQLLKPLRRAELHAAIAGVGGESEPHAHVAAGVREGARVLVAEDNEINRAVVGAFLNKLGVAVQVAHDGREALRLALSDDFDAIFMDCQMPELDGFEVTRQIRATEGDRHVPVIAMTGLSMDGDRERCLAAGMDDYLTKPVRREELETVLARWLGGTERALEVAGGPARTPDPRDA